MSPSAPAGPPGPDGNAALYDALPYSDFPYHRTHPDNLATIASLFGLTPPPIESARVLEIGCGAGGNLVPLAHNFPAARFVGVDVSARHIARAAEVAEAAGVRNLALRCADVLALGATESSHHEGLGPFDYVLCHGVYSWVDAPRRQAILRLAGELLTDHGVACVSYNVYPGWHLGELLRGMLLLAVDRDAPPAAQVARARGWLDDLLTVLEPDDHRLPFLREERQRLARSDDAYVFHEFLAPDNQPFYFAEFLRQATAAGLQYLGNGAPETMLPDLQPEPYAARLRACSSMIEAQQLLDVLGNRRFRTTLLARAAAPVDRELGPQRFEPLLVRAALTPDPAAGDLRSPLPVCVQDERGRSAAVTGAAVRLALAALNREAPRCLPFRELVTTVAARQKALGLDPSPAATLTRDLASHLGRLYFAEMVGFHTAEPPLTNAPGDRPKATAFARAQAGRGPSVTNQWHRTVHLDESERALLQRLDGTYRPQGGDDTRRLERFTRQALLVE